MKNISEIQNYILEKTGLKTSVKFGTGSMKGYLIVMPIFQRGTYPTIDHTIVCELRELLKEHDKPQKPVFCNTSDISICDFMDDRINMKKERKPKEREEMKVKMWGSKNSQLRLDKATARNAVKMNKGNTARYY